MKSDPCQLGGERPRASWLSPERVRWTIGRLVGMAGMVGGLLLCYPLHEWCSFGRMAEGGRGATAQVFFLVVALCLSLVLMTRGLGARVGWGLGAGAGLLGAIGLALHFPATAGNLLVFVVILIGAVGFVGYLAGGWERLEVERGVGVYSEVEARLRTERAVREGGAAESEVSDSACAGGLAQTFGPGVEDRQADELGPGGAVAGVLGAIVGDFSEWIESEAGQRCCSDSPDWSAFDQFVRTTLLERLGAAGVRVYEVSADGEQIEPLARERGRSAGTALREEDQWRSTRAGLIAHIVASGRVYVVDDPDQGAFNRELSESESPWPQGGEPASGEGGPPDLGDVADAWRRWCWLLPLRAAKRTCVLVAVGRVNRPGCRGLSVAEAVRSELEFFWRHMSVQRMLWRFMHTDRQSGLLNRAELLQRLEAVVREGRREGEPLMVLALGVEGLRHLDDSGRWSQRDALVQRLGRTLGEKVRSDDMVGRFSDDRFVVVLRRLDSTLGTLIAEKLLATARAAVLDVREQLTLGTAGRCDGAVGVASSSEGETYLRLRAGLAGIGAVSGAGRPFATFDGEPLAETEAACPGPAGGDEGGSLTDGALGGTVGVGGGESGEPPSSAGALTQPAMSRVGAHRGSGVDAKALLERALGLLDYAREQRIEIATDLMKGLPEWLTRESAEWPAAAEGPDGPSASPQEEGSV